MSVSGSGQGRLSFSWIKMDQNGFQAPTFSIFKNYFCSNQPKFDYWGFHFISFQGKSHFGIICIKIFLGCLKTKKKICFFFNFSKIPLIQGQFDFFGHFSDQLSNIRQVWPLGPSENLQEPSYTFINLQQCLGL